MPLLGRIFRFVDDIGRAYERYFRMEDVPDSITLPNGTVAIREDAERTTHAQWPFECLASGVPAGQADELRRWFKDRGENVEVTPRGNPVYESPQQRKKLLKMRGLHDYDSY